MAPAEKRGAEGKAMAVMMQRFYWDCAVEEKKTGEWWNFLNAEIPNLSKKGVEFDSIWLPPFSKSASPDSNGYDPYDGMAGTELIRMPRTFRNSSSTKRLLRICSGERVKWGF